MENFSEINEINFIIELEMFMKTMSKLKNGVIQ